MASASSLAGSHLVYQLGPGRGHFQPLRSLYALSAIIVGSPEVGQLSPLTDG